MKCRNSTGASAVYAKHRGCYQSLFRYTVREREDTGTHFHTVTELLGHSLSERSGL